MMMLLSVTMAALSCSMEPFEMGHPEKYDGVYTVVVSGTASDTESVLPLEGIKITLHAAETLIDGKGEIRTMTVYTDNRGRFTLKAEGFTRQIACTVTSEDLNNIYGYGRHDINILWDGPSFDERSGTFYVNDCDFYLEKMLK